MTILRNDSGEVYYVQFLRDNPGEFLRRMWTLVDQRGTCNPETDEEACKEWTDRVRDVRSTVHSNTICIRTHAWTPQGDLKGLHQDVLRALGELGIDLTTPDPQPSEAK